MPDTESDAKPVRPRDALGRFADGQPPPVRTRERGPARLPKNLKAEALAACVALGEDGQGKGGLRGYLRANGKLRDAIVVESIPTRPKEDPNSPWLEGSGDGKFSFDDEGRMLGSDGKPMVNVIILEPIASGCQIMPGGKVMDWDEAGRFHAWHKARSDAPPTEEDVNQYIAAGRPGTPPGPLRVIEGGNDEPPAAA